MVRWEDADSSLRVLRNTFPGFADIVLTAKSKTATTTQQTFTVISDTPGAIGFGPYPGAKQAGLNILSIDGRHPTDPAYPSSTIIALIFKEKNRTGVIDEFVKFTTSPAAFPAIRRAYGVPY